MNPKNLFTSIITFLFFFSLSAQTDNEALWDAATKNDTKALQALLEKGVDVNARTHYGTTALTFAAYKNNLEAVKILLEKGADPNIKDSFYGATPFNMSFDKSHKEIVILMINHGADLSSGEELRNAVDMGLIDLVQLMLEKGAAGADKATIFAAGKGETEILALILKTSKLNDETLTDALIAAMANNKKDAINVLEKAGAKVPVKQATIGLIPVNKGIKGIYKNNDEGSLELDLKDSTFTVSFEGGPEYKLKNASDTSLVLVDYPDIVITWQEVGGRVVSTRILQRGHVAQFIKTETPIKPEAITNRKKEVIDETGKVTKAINWTSFRGNHGDGLGDGQYPPTQWDVKKGVNLVWKTFIPGLAHSSPVIWGNRVYVTTAMSGDTAAEYRVGLFGDVEPAKDSSSHIWKMYCLDKASGKIIWEKKAYEGVPRVKRHIKGTQANATPVTNGEYIVAIFGSEGIVCYDMNGNEKWRKDLGLLDAGWFYEGSTQWGPASSPVTYEDMVIVQCDKSRDSYIAAYDLKSGKEVWKTNRDEISSWGTPALYIGKPHDELITNSSRFIRGYNPKTGEELWRLAPNSEVTVGSPVVADSLFFVTGGYPPVYPIYAIKAGGRGDISIPDSLNAGKFIQWRTKRGGTYMPTPIYYDGYLYTLAWQAILTCYDARTGEKKYQKTIKDGKSYSASPVAADGKLYLTSEENGVTVVKAGPEFEIISTNPVGEICMATPAISDGMIFIRAQHHVFCIGRKKQL